MNAASATSISAEMPSSARGAEQLPRGGVEHRSFTRASQPLSMDEMDEDVVFATARVTSVSRRPAAATRVSPPTGPGFVKDEDDVDDTSDKASSSSKEPAKEPEASASAVPNWRDQITLRGYVLGTALGGVFSIIIVRMNVGYGIQPPMNIAAGLMGYFFLKVWSRMSGLLLERLPLLPPSWGTPFTKQEVNFVQTLTTAVSSVAGVAGFGNYNIAMDQRAYDALNAGGVYLGTADSPDNVLEPSLRRYIPYLLCITLVGVFGSALLRKWFILRLNLAWPSGTATGVMINTFFSADGAAAASSQIRALTASCLFAFLWDCANYLLQWPPLCLASAFGCSAYRWKINWAINLVGAGMIVPTYVNASMMFGAFLSWGILWPLLDAKQGDWYPEGLNAVDTNSFAGGNGYRIFITIALLMGDGLYNIARIAALSATDYARRRRQATQLPDRTPSKSPSTPSAAAAAGGSPQAGEEEMLLKETAAERRERLHFFMLDAIPWQWCVAGFAGMTLVGTVAIPHLYPGITWYHTLGAYLLAFVLVVPDAYGCGLTDWDMCGTYAKIAVFVFAAWGGESAGLFAGLVSAGIVMACLFCSTALLQDFRTGYLTLCSPLAMFIGQSTGVLLGSIVAPLAFWLFWATGQVQDPNGQYPAPNAVVYRGMAVLGSAGFGQLPKYCGYFMLGFFALAVLLNVLRTELPTAYGRFVPLPMAMAIPMIVGPYIAVQMSIGSFILETWTLLGPDSAQLLGPAVASGLLVGDGLFSIPGSIMGIANVPNAIQVALGSVLGSRPPASA